MTAGATTPSQAVIICTRNRSDDLRRTLHSISALDECPELLILVVDGSDEDHVQPTRHTVSQFSELELQYLRFKEPPAGTRQRNYGIDHLPPSVEIVHFIDDDVTILHGYFQRSATVLRDNSEVGGVGSLVIEPPNPPRPTTWVERFFLLSSSQPGRVLPSGQTSPAQNQPASTLVESEWLNGCSSYRRTVVDRFRWDPSVEGHSPRYEDLDFSYRVGQEWRLVVETRVRLIHHISSTSRYNVERRAFESVPRRRWFVDKNIRHPLRVFAFWWSTLGRALIFTVSTHPKKWKALRGLARGVWATLQRSHPLLRSSV